MQKTFLITDRNGKGIITIESNDLTLVINTPVNQVSEVTHIDKRMREDILKNPMDFEIKAKKLERRQKEKK